VLTIVVMHRLAQAGTLVAIAAGLLLLDAAPAYACSGLECTPSMWFPRTGTVPANLPGLLWWPSVWNGGIVLEDGGAPPGADAAFVRFARVEGASFELLEFELRTLPESDETGPFLLVPNAPLVPGASYVLWDGTSCHPDRVDLESPPPVFVPPEDFADEIESWVARIRVAETAPLPNEFGSLRAEEPLLGSVLAPESSGCAESISAVYSDLLITLSDDAAPWADALFYETEVDGRRYLPIGDYHRIDAEPGTPWVGRTFDRVYTSCSPDAVSEGVSEGRHRARMRASIPGTDIVLHSDEVSLDLRCPAPPADAGPDASATDDAALDASAVVDASGEEAGDPPSIPGNDDSPSAGGCSCSVRDRPRALGDAWPLAAAWAWALVRSRRLRRHGDAAAQ
jgi:hypothetical protein